jgi:hypothetical protein
MRTQTTPRSRRLLGVIVAMSMVVLVPATASAATVSSSYAVRGYEYYATSTQGRFSGTASGNTGDSASWNAVVNHTELTTTATITGGSASLLTSRLVYIQGSFAGGEVHLVDQPAGCSYQKYAVTGTLANVTRSDSSVTGTGSFVATLTHYRTRILGRCVVYSAGVAGTISLSF